MQSTYSFQKSSFLSKFFHKNFKCQKKIVRKKEKQNKVGAVRDWLALVGRRLVVVAYHLLLLHHGQKTFCLFLFLKKCY